MLMDFILALGLLLTTASQLRPDALPVGPGELLIVLWCGVTVVAEMARGGPRSLRAVTPLLLFWCAFTIAQMVGLIVGQAIEPFRGTTTYLHDVVAYTLMAGLCCLIFLRADPLVRIERVALYLVLAGGCVTALMLVAASGLGGLPLDLWYWSRFRGWSENPNQFALLASVMLLVGVHLFQTPRSLAVKLALLASISVAALAGALTKSDSFMLFVMIAVCVLASVTAWSAFRASGSGLQFGPALAGLFLLALPFMGLAAVPAAPAIGDKVQGAIERMMADNDQASERFKLWNEAYDVGVQAMLLGFGPGPHLTSKEHKRQPPAKFEAHNTPLDIFVQAGLAGVSLFFAILLLAFYRTCREQHFALAALVLSLVTFSLFHFILRQPIFWFALCLCFAACEMTRRVRDASDEVEQSGATLAGGAI